MVIAPIAYVSVYLMVAPYVKCACVIFGLVAPAGSHHHVWDRHLEVHAEDEYDHSEDGEDDRWIWK